jgi:hypothetical protein
MGLRFPALYKQGAQAHSLACLHCNRASDLIALLWARLGIQRLHDPMERHATLYRTWQCWSALRLAEYLPFKLTA